MLAVKLERELPKTEILNRYLNAIYFGRGAYGVEAASKAYFGKDVGTLDAARGGLPGRADPLAGDRRRWAGRARRRAGGRPPSPATSVLDNMVADHYITQAAARPGRRPPLGDSVVTARQRRHLARGPIGHTDQPARSTSSTTCAAAGRRRASSPTPSSTAVACASTRRSTTACSRTPSTRSPRRSTGTATRRRRWWRSTSQGRVKAMVGGLDYPTVAR